MGIDWGAAGTMVAGLGAWASAGAIAWAAHVGSNTFDRWRRQKSEERRFDLAEEVLTAGYACRRSLEFARDGVVWGEDKQSAETRLREAGVITGADTMATINWKTTAQIVITRLASEAWDSLVELRARA